MLPARQGLRAAVSGNQNCVNWNRSSPLRPSPSIDRPFNPRRSLPCVVYNSTLYLYHSQSALNRVDSTPDLDSSTATSSSSVEIKFLPWLAIKRVPSGWWEKTENQRIFLDWLGTKLGYHSREDWYRVSRKDFLRNRGSYLLHLFDQSPIKAITSIYSDFNYLPWLFDRVSRNYFHSLENRKLYIDWLVKKVGLTSRSELKSTHFVENGGYGLLHLYNRSPQQILDSIQYRDCPKSITISSLESKGRNFWLSHQNQKEFLDSLGVKIGVRGDDLSPWYEISTAELLKLGGRGPLSHHNNSMYKMLSSVYPAYRWEPWRFKSMPVTAIKSPEVVSSALAFIENSLKIERPEDWYRVSDQNLKELRVFNLIKAHGGLSQCLKTYREFKWIESNFGQ